MHACFPSHGNATLRHLIAQMTAFAGVFAFVLFCMLWGTVSAHDDANWQIGQERSLRSFAVAARGGAVDGAIDKIGKTEKDAELEEDRSDEATTLLHRLRSGGRIVGGFHPSEEPDPSDTTGTFITPGVLEVLLSLATLAALAASFTAYRLRVALKRIKKGWGRPEAIGQRRHVTTYLRDHVAQTAQTLAAGQAAHVVAQARCTMLANLRREVATPLAAIEGLLDSWVSPAEGTALPQASAVRVALKTGVRMLNDMLDPHNPSFPEGQAIVLDESDTDLRELIDGVIALFAIPVAHKKLNLKVRVDRSADLRILVDGSRLGQVIYYLLSEAMRVPSASCATEQIEFAVWAETLNGDLQQIFFSVTRYGGQAEGAVREPAFLRIGFGTATDSTEDHGFALYRLLVERMHGEMTVVSDPDFGTRWTFSAPFATSLVPQLARLSAPRDITPPPGDPVNVRTDPAENAEPFDRHYLDALSHEGLDLHVFLRRWRHSVEDDLAQLYRLQEKGDAAGLHAVLHRLSGAVGMVGGHSLMKALQDELAAQSLLDGCALDTLARRTRLLQTQLDATFEQLGSSVQ